MVPNMKSTFVLLIPLFLLSCNRIPDKVNQVLALSTNRAALEEVIEHYKKTGEKDKLKAAYFLIGNMQDKYYIEGEEIHHYDSIFNVFSSYHDQKKFIYKNSPVIRAQWDSIKGRYGKPAVDEMDMELDYNTIQPDYLIDNIDQAFRWYQTGQNEKMSFENFCEYLLPYRMLNEKPEDWRRMLYTAYKPLFDKAGGGTQVQVVDSVNTALEKIFDTNYILWGYPFDISVSNMMKARRGACRQIVGQTARIFRAHGIPVGIDYTPMWGDRPNGHYWNTLLLANGDHFPFEGATIPFKRKNRFTYRTSKVYRMTYALQDIPMPDAREEVPDFLLDRRRIDVSPEYNKCYSFSVPIRPASNKHNFKSAVICTYGKVGWKAQDWGPILDGQAHFTNMGSNLLYVVMYYYGHEYIPASNPFVLEANGQIREIVPDKQLLLHVRLTRKNPNWVTNVKNTEASIGSRIEGANKPDFSDAVTLCEIAHATDRYERLDVSSTQKFKYLRFRGPDKKNASVAEIEFYGEGATDSAGCLKGRVIGYPEVTVDAATPYEHAFDRDPDTYFFGGKASYGWAGLALPAAVRVRYIRYCPRNDTNFVIPGDAFELFMWDGAKWVSLGQQVAADQELHYEDVPANAVLLLRNLSRGDEERVFTYENGQQVWW